MAPVARRSVSCVEVVERPSRTKIPPWAVPPTTSQQGPDGGFCAAASLGRGAGCAVGNDSSASCFGDAATATGTLTSKVSSRVCPASTRVASGSGAAPPLPATAKGARPKASARRAPVGSAETSRFLTSKMVAPAGTATDIVSPNDRSIVTSMVSSRAAAGATGDATTAPAAEAAAVGAAGVEGVAETAGAATSVAAAEVGTSGASLRCGAAAGEGTLRARDAAHSASQRLSSLVRAAPSVGPRNTKSRV
mmetsp:Transcript_124181/g.397182  ORF Transcript_124181/g.397182 Transcript_124181/m.397182 type:complete len:250 (-) Transcript_124181:297-1046(-)